MQLEEIHAIAVALTTYTKKITKGRLIFYQVTTFEKGYKYFSKNLRTI